MPTVEEKGKKKEKHIEMPAVERRNNKEKKQIEIPVIKVDKCLQ